MINISAVEKQAVVSAEPTYEDVLTGVHQPGQQLSPLQLPSTIYINFEHELLLLLQDIQISEHIHWFKMRQ